MYTFPDRPVLRNYKIKERAVVEHIRSHFPSFDWKYDRRIQDGCSLRRPDLYLDMGSQIIIIEIDENGHKTYDCSCENKRIMQLSQDVYHRSIVFIRFNPDKYTDIHGKVHQSCWTVNGNGIPIVHKNRTLDWDHRLNTLTNTMHYWAKNETDKTIETIELFFG
jgi:hypothetical protein